MAGTTCPKATLPANCLSHPGAHMLPLRRTPPDVPSTTHAVCVSGETYSYPLHPCPCGFHGDTTRECRCTGGIIQRYLSKISGPLLDRIDLHIEVPAVPYKEMRGSGEGECSAVIRERVLRTRSIQQTRGFYNSQIPARVLRKLCELDDAGERTLEMAVRRMGLSARAHDRLLKVSRTIADLGGSASVTAKHVAEAVQYRSLDRNYWS